MSDLNLLSGAHRRYSEGVPVTLTRAEGSGEGRTPALINGIAARTGEVYSIGGWWNEFIEAGAFDDVLNDDVRCLFNHNSSLVLARRNAKGSSSLELSISAEGHLAYSYTTPDRTFAWDLQDMIEKGDVDQCSFQFTISDASWEKKDGEDVYVIKKVGGLYDVGPVTFPAHEGTVAEIAKRSKELIQMPSKRTFNTEILQHKTRLLHFK
jgi:uncharacterized protein